MDSAVVASLLTAFSGVHRGACAPLALAVSRVRCVYKRNREGDCDPRCGCTDVPLNDPDELEIHKLSLKDEVLVIIKRS